MSGIVRGIRTDCNDSASSNVELEYRIEEYDEPKMRIFYLIGGVTGYESFCIDDYNGKLKVDTILAAKKYGWRANVGTKGIYDELFIPAEEMKLVLDAEGL